MKWLVYGNIIKERQDQVKELKQQRRRRLRKRRFFKWIRDPFKLYRALLVQFVGAVQCRQRNLKKCVLQVKT